MSMEKIQDDFKNNLKTGRGTFFQNSTVLGKEISVPDLMKELHRQKDTKKDFVVPNAKMEMGVTGKFLEFPAPKTNGQVQLLTAANGNEMDDRLKFGITDHCHSQISEKLQIPKRYYDKMQKGIPPLLAKNVNGWLQKSDGKRMVRTLDGNARAFLSDRFKAIDNLDVAFASFKTIADQGGEIVRADLTDHRFYIKAINPAHLEAPEWDPEGFLGGVVVSNSEVGLGALNVGLFTYRVHCKNGMIGEKVLKKQHLGGQLEAGVYEADTIEASSKAILLQFRDLVRQCFDGTKLSEWIKQYGELQGYEIEATVTELTNGDWSIVGMNDAEKDLTLKKLFGSDFGVTGMGLVDSITETARDLEDRDRAANLERLGFKMSTMDQNQFEGQITAIVGA